MELLAGPLAPFPGGAEAIVRAAYGIFATLLLAQTVLVAHRFYSSETYGGYLFAGRWPDRFATPWFARAATVAWLICTLGLATDHFTFVAALGNVAFARLFYVELRWAGIGRGMGAPGQMSYWLGLFVLLLEIARYFDRGGMLRGAVVAAFRIDFAAIMFAAGIYKITVGYLRGTGAAAGLVNPFWGFFHRWLRALPARHWSFRSFDALAVVFEIVCAVLFLVPAVSPYAGYLFGASFLVVGMTVRLTWLAEMVAVCTLVYATPFDLLGAHLTPAVAPPDATGIAAAAVLVLTVTVVVYAVLLPFAYAGMWYNFYARKRLAAPLQFALDWWTRRASLILWRVFTPDLVDFYVDVDCIDAAGGRRAVRSRERSAIAGAARRWHVGEYITLASVFTTRRYYPDDDAIFHRRLTVYARSVGAQPGEQVVFRMQRVESDERSWSYRPVTEFIVDPATGTCTEERLDATFDARRPAAGSPVHAGVTPGSYAPAPRAR